MRKSGEKNFCLASVFVLLFGEGGGKKEKMLAHRFVTLTALSLSLSVDGINHRPWHQKDFCRHSLSLPFLSQFFVCV